MSTHHKTYLGQDYPELPMLLRDREPEMRLSANQVSWERIELRTSHDVARGEQTGFNIAVVGEFRIIASLIRVSRLHALPRLKWGGFSRAG